MSKILRVAILCEMTPDVVHRFRNFGEDVFLALRESCRVSIDEIDASSSFFHIRDIRAREVRTVTQQVMTELRRHGFADCATVSPIAFPEEVVSA